MQTINQQQTSNLLTMNDIREFLSDFSDNWRITARATAETLSVLAGSAIVVLIMYLFS